jgi:hypothetical protein
VRIPSVLSLLAATVVAAATGIVATAPPASAVPPCPHPLTSAANRRTAMASARLCGRRVKADDRTDEQSETYANPDGTYTVETAATPQRVRQADGSWSPIDTGLRRIGGRIEPGAVTEKVSFSAGGKDPLIAVATKAGRWTLGWPGALPTPSIEGDTAVYADVRPGVDLRVRALPTGFSYVLVVRDRLALTTFQPVHLTVSGPAVKPRANGGVEVVAPDGSLLLSSGGGLMWDSTDEATATGPGDTTRSAPVGVRAGPGEIVLTPDPAVLADPALRLPVFIDPQTSGPIRWAYSDSTNVNRDDGIARVGLNPDGSGVYRSFFEFPMGSVAGTRIIAASMNTVLIHSWSCGPTPVGMYWAGGLPAGVNGTRVSYSTALLAVLDQQSGNAHKPSSGSGCGNDPQPDMAMTFTGGLTGKVQEWANSGVAATTLALSARDSAGNNESTADRWKKFSPGATWLVIKYNSLPGTPALDGLSATGISATIGCYTAGTSDQPSINTSGGVHLKAVLTDRDEGDNLVARFEYQDLTAGSAIVAAVDTPAFPSGHQFDIGIPASFFKIDHDFQWRVHGFDGTDNGPVSSWCHFGNDGTAPGQPILTSTDLPVYPGTPTANAVVGKPATVTATPAAGDTDVIGYYYGVGSVPTAPTIYIPAAGGVGRIPVVPVVSGLQKNFLTVVAIDAAGNRSPVPVPNEDAPGTRQFRADPGTVHHVRGDVTGDGKADITTAFDLGGAKSKLLDFTTKADGSTVFNPASPITNDAHVMELNTTHQLMGDFNGDGKSDIVSIRDDGGCRMTAWVYLSTGNSYAPSNAPWWDSGGGNWCFANADKYVVGDFNGDGKDDVATFYDYGAYQVKLWVTVSLGTTFVPPAVWWDSGQGQFDWTRFRTVAGDFNHDGRDDIGALYDYGDCHAGMFRFLSTGSGAIIGGWPDRTWFVNSAYAWCIPNTMNLLPGDFNGDGYGDITAMYNYGNNTWKVFTWFGPDLANGIVTGANSGPSNGASLKAVTGDFNGDGKTDLAHFYNSGTNETTLWVLYNTGSALSGENLRWDSNVEGALDWYSLKVIQ